MSPPRGGRQRTGPPNEGPQHVPTRGQRGTTHKVKVHTELSPKTTFSLGTGQAGVLAADKALGKQTTVPSFCSSKKYYPTGLEPSCSEISREHPSNAICPVSWALAWLSNTSSHRSPSKALVTHATRAAPHQGLFVRLIQNPFHKTPLDLEPHHKVGLQKKKDKVTRNCL